MIFDNNYEYLIDTNGKFGDDKKYFDFMFMSLDNLKDENEILKYLLNDDVDQNDDKIILTNHLDKMEENKLSKCKNNSSLNKFYIVICKCINFENLISKSNEKISEDKSLDDILQIIKMNYEKKSKDDFPIIELQDDENNNKSFYIYKNKSLIIPEYLIEYNYIQNNPLGISLDSNVKVSNSAIIQSSFNYNKPNLNENDLNLFNSCCKKIYSNENKFLKYFDNKIFQKYNYCKFAEYEEFENNSFFFAKASILKFVNKCFKYTKQEEFFEEYDKIKEKIEEISTLNFKFNNYEILVNKSDFNNLKIVNLFNSNLNDEILNSAIDTFKNSNSIEEFRLSCNHLKNINFDKINSVIKNLTFLDLSHNKIKNIIYKNDNSIKHLDLSFNKLDNIETLNKIIKSAELQYFNFIGNPFPKEYLFIIKFDYDTMFTQDIKNPEFLNKLSKIKSEDSINIKSDQKLNLKQFDVIYDTYSFDKKYISFSENDLFKQMINKEKYNLFLSKKKFTTIPNLDKYSNISQDLEDNLKVLYLSLNKIEKLENLEKLKNLEELYIQNNKITKIENLENLTKLIRLDISSNLIQSLEGVGLLKSLQWLNIENNMITSLLTNELVLLENLVELHASGNLLTNLKECLELKKLNKIQVLDLSNNEVTKKNQDFRLYLIYYVNKIQVLNKLHIDKNEITQATLYFDGKITNELLESKLGNFDLNCLIELNLSNCKLKDNNNTNEAFFTQNTFCNLKKLNLSRNLFTSFKVFGNLPTLIELNLNSNMFERIIEKRERLINQKGILGLLNLEILELSNNSLLDLSGLTNLKSLKNLILRQNNINKIDFIDNLPHLIFLDISMNKLRNIEKSNVGLIPNLKTLICDSNFLKNINAFCKLQNLIFISFDNNKINDFSMIEKLTIIESLKEINLNNNSITQTFYYRSNMIKKFFNVNRIDGVEVTREEKEMAIMEMQMNNDNFEPVIENNYNMSAMNIIPNNKNNLNNSKPLVEKFPVPMKVNMVNLDLSEGYNPFFQYINSGVNSKNNILKYKISSPKNNFDYDLNLPQIYNMKNNHYAYPHGFPNVNLNLNINSTLFKNNNNKKEEINNLQSIYNKPLISNNNSNKNIRSSKIKVSNIQMGKLFKQIGEAISLGNKNNKITKVVIQNELQNEINHSERNKNNPNLRPKSQKKFK